MVDPRIPPMREPYPPAVARMLQDMMLPKPMRGQQVYEDFAEQEPLKFMRTWVHHLPLTQAFQDVRDWVHSGSRLPARERELVALRVCALTGFEVEWGIRVFAYGTKIGLSEAVVEATATAPSDDAVWSPEDAAVVRLVDELHTSGDVTDETWHRLAEAREEPELLELLFFTGWYHTIAFVGNGVRAEGEDWAVPYPTPGRRPPACRSGRKPGITQLVELSARPGCRAEFVRLLQLVAAAAETEPGTRTYALFTSPGSGTVRILEEYDDDQALQVHLAGEALTRIRPRLAELRTGPPLVIPLLEGGPGDPPRSC